jgi:threonine dehydratase
VLAYSSGNHAQAVALVGKLLGAPTTIVMPSTAPTIKREATEAFGAAVVPYDMQTESREAIAKSLQHERGLTLIPPFDHPHVIAGQGTAALELHGQQTGIDTLLVPCGGGGLLTGSALASLGVAPRCRVVGVEPELADDATRSFRTRTLQTVSNPATIADGTRTASLGALTFPLMLEHVADMVTVTETAIADAVRFLFLRTKLVVEPSGALGVAALLSGAIRPEGRVGVILSGGNVDPETMVRILNP